MRVQRRGAHNEWMMYRLSHNKSGQREAQCIIEKDSEMCGAAG
jgi:hypothetical protein